MKSSDQVKLEEIYESICNEWVDPNAFDPNYIDWKAIPAFLAVLAALNAKTLAHEIKKFLNPEYDQQQRKLAQQELAKAGLEKWKDALEKVKNDIDKATDETQKRNLEHHRDQMLRDYTAEVIALEPILKGKHLDHKIKQAGI